MKTKSTIFILVGATASGKTDISTRLAKDLPIEIINADSLQVFRAMDIGTAKPSPSVLQQVPHHLIDILNPHEEFTSKQYRAIAEEKIHDVVSRNKIPLLVGGAGFYLKALVQPSDSLPSGTAAISNYEVAYKTLMERDPQSKIHPNDHYRISRALFLIENGLIPSQSYQSNNEPFDTKWFGISWPRDILRKRIADRVQQMFDVGLVDETKHVLEKFPGSAGRLSKTIGYRESLGVLAGNVKIKDAIEMTTIETSQYAKRQETWFRKNAGIQWCPFAEAASHFSFSIRDSLQV